jgi:hypothetical protein
MKIIRPLDVTDAMVTASNLTEDAHLPWAVGTTYARGDFATSLTTHTVYRSLVDANTGNDPDVEQVAINDPFVTNPSPIYWQVFSATNLWKLFDKKPSVPATGTTSVTLTVTPAKFVTGVAVFNVTGVNTLLIEMKVSGTTVYSVETAMQDESVVVDGWSYYFSEIQQLPELVLTDLPPYSTATIEFTFTGDNIGIGQVCFGPIWEIGYVETGESGFRGLDFSDVGVDEYGNLKTNKRAATSLHTFDIVLDVNETLGFRNRMNELRGGVPVVWVGDENRRKAATSYGFYRSYRPIYSEGDETLITIETQGIV